MISGYTARIALQAAYFVAVGRGLGVHEYGMFVGAAALANIFSPFGSMGAGHIMIRDTARDPSSLRLALGEALGASAFFGVIVVAVYAMIAQLVLPAQLPSSVIVAIGLSDIVATQTVEICGQVFQVERRGSVGAVILIFPNVVRLIAAASYWLSGVQASAVAWAWLYAASGVTSAVVIGTATVLMIRPLAPLLRPMLRRAKDGWTFALMASSQVANNDTDKTILTRLAAAEAVGIYTAAYRVIDVAMAPIRALMYSAYARFFAHGRRGLQGTVPFAKRLTKYSVAYATVAAGLLWVAAPLLPALLGGSFSGSVGVLRFIAALLPLKALQAAGADALSSSGHSHTRAGAQVTIVVVNISLNLWLVPQYSWKGAAIASLVCDSLLAIGYWTLVSIRARQQSNLISTHNP